ncbi:MAG TPA: SDR family oxidoreductase [Cyclobacteriaceae bacterium]|nr:SDR family oxidoreductase [Cyclobacteriaceae bacterium]
MKVLVTGANGLLGQKLCELLAQDVNIKLIATAKDALKYQINKASIDLLDISNALQVEEIFSKYQPDVVVHTAALTNVDECELNKVKCWEINVDGTEHLLKAAAKIQAHFIFISTDFIFDGTQELLDENAVAAPVNYYGESKLAAEKLTASYVGPWSIIRTVLVYGYNPHMSRSNIVLWVKESLEAKKEIQVVADQLRTPTFADDLALGCYQVIKKKATGIYHISGEELMSPYDIAIKVANHFKLDSSFIKKSNSTEFKQPAVRPLKTGFNIQKAKSRLAYEPKSFDESLKILSEQLQNT